MVALSDRAVAAIVGRERELEATEAVLAPLAHGTRALLVEGEPGIGKTCLWREALLRAEARGYRVLSCRPVASEAQLAFAALTDLLADALPDTLPHLPDPQRHALEVALLLADPGVEPVDQRAVSMALLSSLRALAESQPLLVAIDDVQWLDSSSAAALEFAVRRLRHEQVALLLTLRDSGESEVPIDFERALDGERLTRIRLGPLSLGAVHRLLRQAMDTAFPRAILLRLHGASGGNPLFALELARAVQRRGGRLGEERELPIPPRLDELLYERVAALSAEVRELLALAAMVADPMVSLLEGAFGYDIEPALAEACAADVVSLEHRRIRFSHPLLASACLAKVGNGRRRELHRRLAEVVDSTEERVRHLALAAERPDLALCILLEDAATASRARGAWVAAAELLEHARRLTPPSKRRAWARRSAALVDLLYHGGDRASAMRVAEEVIAHAEPGEDRALALALWSVWNPHRLKQAEQALAEVGSDPALRARIGLMTALTRCAAGDLRGSAAAVRRALADARRARTPEMIVQALTAASATMLMPTDFDRAAARRGLKYLREAAKLEENLPQRPPPLLSTPKTGLAYHAVWAEELEEARRLFQEEATRVSEHGEEGSLHQILWAWADMERRAGNLARALELATESQEVAERASDVGSQLSSLWCIALIQAMVGPLHEARLTLARATADAIDWGDQIIIAGCRGVGGVIEACAGDYHAVVREVGTLPEELEALGRLDPARAAWVAAGEEIEARIALGDLELARKRVEQLEERSRHLDRRRPLGVALRARGILLAAEGDLDSATAVFEASLDVLQGIQAPYERARTLLALGAVLRRAKQKRAARQSLESAVAALEELGAAPWAAKARAELARIGGRAPAVGELTPTERRVAELVAAGRSNREVATALFVTARTVEWNLTKIYAKLGVRSRAGLAHVLAKTSSADR
jgi:DNA-binding CsgD family transcriptional regulator